MKILVTNDDGIQAESLKTLVKKAMQFGEVICIAPIEEQSGKSQSLIIKEPFIFKQVEDIIEGVKTYVISSTPADCVRVAYSLLDKDYDLILSGVNDGYNLGEDIHYSGTMAAATEAAILGKKTIAFSTKFNDVDKIYNDLSKVMEYIMENKLLDVWPLYNVNIPLSYKGIKFAGQGHTHFEIIFDQNGDYVRSVGRPVIFGDDSEESDVQVVFENYVSIAPLRYNRTNKDIINKLVIK